MSVSIITVGTQTVNLVSFPTAAGLKGYDFTMEDKVGIVTSVFTGQIQAQQWPGADMWGAMLGIAPRAAADADDWVSFLMELRGMSNGFQLGDVTKATPRGSAAGAPLVDNTGLGGNLAGSPMLATKGWTASAAGVLKRGDQIQVGYRLYACLDDVNADGSGNAVIPVWPSLRELPTDSGAVVTANAQGLWRLAKNQRAYSRDINRLTRISIPIQEYR